MPSKKQVLPVELRDPVGRQVTIIYNSGEMRRYWFQNQIVLKIYLSVKVKKLIYPAVFFVFYFYIDH